MARIGKRKLVVPKGVEVKMAGGVVSVKGPKGTLAEKIDPRVEISIADGTLSTICKSNDPKVLAMQGLYNALIGNMIKGVIEEFEKKLELVGVGYRAAKEGKNLSLALGYSHPVVIPAPQGIEFIIEGTNKITVKGSHKQVVGEISAKIRRVRPVEPYKGKGVRYAGEKVRKKAGKAAKVGTGA